MAEYEVCCAQCGDKLYEPISRLTQQPPPCPTCGSQDRAVSVTTGAVVMGAVASLRIGGPVVRPPVSGSARVTGAATVKRLNATQRCTLKMAATEGGLQHIEVLDATGNVLTVGMGDDLIEALLELVCLLIPPGYPACPTKDPDS